LETRTNDYNFSLFKPTTPYGKRNRNLILTLLIIWFVAIFGFQGLLLIFQKPTPEKALITFESVWENVKTEKASDQEKKELVNSLISVAGKSSVKAKDRLVLTTAITYYVSGLISDPEKIALSENVKELASTKEKLAKASDTEFAQLKLDLTRIKANINAIANESTGIDPTKNKDVILPYSLNAEIKELTAGDMEALPKVMKLYLTHNQSFLTDTKFLGFPFHYFYTSEFLLILFVGLCLYYSIRITQLQKKFSIMEG